VRKDLLIPLAVLLTLATVILFVVLSHPFDKVKNLLSSPTPFPTISGNSNQEAQNITSSSSSENIEVLTPRGGDTVKSGFAVKGNARTFESNVAIRLSEDSNGILEVYQYSAKDGSEIDKVTIPLLFSK